MDEIWKPIPSLEANYEASNLGRLRRCTASRGAQPGRILNDRPLPAGYRMVCFHLAGKTIGRLVHRMIAEAFIGPPAKGIEVNHKDSNKANNRADNLEYVTRSQKIKHAIESTGAYRGERNSQAIISAETVLEIRRLHGEGMGYTKLARHFSLSWGLVRDVAARRNWKHI